MTSNQLPEPLPKYCILCVDDDLIGLGARAALLEEEGYSVTVVSCPLMALEHDVSKFHMAILDFAMPVLNGFTRGPSLPTRSTVLPAWSCAWQLLHRLPGKRPNPARAPSKNAGTE
jgi:hypothetical protein